MTASKLLRILSIVVTPFVVFQLINPIREWFACLGIILNPSTSYSNPSGYQVFFETSRQLAIAISMLAIPLLFWVVSKFAAPGNRMNSD